MKNQSSIKRAKIIDGIWTYLVLALLAFIWLVPLMYVVGTAFRGESSGLIANSFFPEQWTTLNFKTLFEVTRAVKFGKWLMNTVKLSVLNCIGSTVITMFAAYALSRFRFKTRKLMMNVSLVLGMFPGFLSMSAIFIILSMVRINGAYVLVGNEWSLLIIYLSGAGLGFFVTKGYLDTVSRSLDEAARIDGAGQATIFFRIILPLCKPILIYVALMAFMAPWTDYVLATLILGADSTREHWTVPVGLYTLTDATNISRYFTTFAAGCVIVAVPIVILYLALQRFMIQGISAGAVKG